MNPPRLPTARQARCSLEAILCGPLPAIEVAFGRPCGYEARVIAVGPILFVATVAAMEAVAYAAHRWIMHGPGWFLHASHHRPRDGAFELNDLYAVIFAVPSIVLLAGGVRWGWGSGWAWAGAGVAAYGAIYFGFHDIVVHRRLAHRYVPRSRYMKRIVQAHRLHHVVATKAGSVSFGFLWADRPEALRATLRRRGPAGVRPPRAAPGGSAPGSCPGGSVEQA